MIKNMYKNIVNNITVAYQNNMVVKGIGAESQKRFLINSAYL